MIPDVRRPDATEVYAIEAVYCTAPHLLEPITSALLLFQACR